MNSVKKAVIPIAGFGTRFLPATKSIPKELFPIVDIPAIFYVVEEALEAGITDIVFVTNRYKHAVTSFFESSYELEEILLKQDKYTLLTQLQLITRSANILSVIQKYPAGLGDAVLCAKPIVGKEPFAVLLPDEIICTPSIPKLVDIHKKTKMSVIAVTEVPEKDISKYGIVQIKPNTLENHIRDTYKVTGLVEKPKNMKEAKSTWAMPGRYVFTPEIFECLENMYPGKNGEIQLTDAIAKLVPKEKLLAYTLETVKYDVGDKLGFIQANIEFALKRPNLGNDLKKYIINLAETLK